MKASLPVLCLSLWFCATGSAQPNCTSSSVRCVGKSQEYTTIQSAANDAGPGDMVYVFDGAYAGFSLGASHVSGSAASPITFKAQSPNTIINAAGNAIGDGVAINRVDYVVIDGFTITGMSRSGINIVESTGSVAQNNVINSSGMWGILTGFAYQVKLLNNKIDGVAGQHGIYVSNSNRPFDGPVVRGNIISNVAGNGIQLNGDCQTLDSTGHSDGILSFFVIDSNVIHDIPYHAIMLIDAQNGLIRNNLSYLTGTDAVQSNTECGIGSSNNAFVNNTFDASLGPNRNGFRFVQPTTGNIIFNNVIVTDDGRACVDDATAAQCPSNGTDGTYYSGNLKVGVAQAASGVFRNYAGRDYTPIAGSPLVDSAAKNFMGLLAPALDLSGNLRPAGASIDYGALEYNSTPAPPDTTPPAAPGTPTYSATTTSVSLSFATSTDNREVLGYYIYRNGALYDAAGTNQYVDSKVTAGVTYAYSAAAFDSSFNISPVSGTTSVTVPGIVGCLNATSSFQYRILPTQTGAFTFEMDVTPFPQSAGENGTIGLSSSMPSDYNSLAAIVAFSSAGIQARNGGAYTSDIPVSWVAGTSYHVRMLVDLGSHTYSVYVTAPGKSEVRLAYAYAFRTEQAAVKTINYLVYRNDSGVNTICNASLGGTKIDSMTLIPIVGSDGTAGTALFTGTGGGNPTGGSIMIGGVTGLQDALNAKQPLLGYIPERALTFQSPLSRSGDTVSCAGCGGSAGSGSGSATFVKIDTTTGGNWTGVYGRDGYNIISESASSYPPYAVVTPMGNQSVLWAKNTSDVRALLKTPNSSQRSSGSWYVDPATGTFSIDLIYSDNGTHQLALYLVDWDYFGRSEKIEIVDTNNRVLDTRTISNFSGGQYGVWTVSGHVIIRLTTLTPSSSAVVSGIFFR